MESRNCICVMSTMLTGGTQRHYMEMANTYSFRSYVLFVEYNEKYSLLRLLHKGNILQQEWFFGDDIESYLYRKFSSLNVRLIHLHHFIYMNEKLRKFLLT